MHEYKGKTLLIIGAGLLQVPAITIANELGLKTVVTDYNPEAPGMKIADYPVVMSTRDIDGTVRVIKELNKKVKIDGVITVGTDASMTVSAVANALNLPGIEFENALAASNKLKMRERFEKFNVPSPKFYKCWSLKDLKNISNLLDYPMVIKPIDNMGARGVMKIENESMLEMAFYNAKNASPSGELIVEEYMKGAELSIDALIYNNEIYITGIADRIIEREPYFIELGHVMPSCLPEEKINDAVEVFKKGIKALGLNIGAAKGDIKVTDEGAKIGEIAARLSGGFMSAYTYPYSSGVNLIHNAIDIALGYPPHNLIPTANRVSIEKAIIPAPGIINEIIGIDEALSIAGVKNIFLHVNIGDEVKDPKNNVEKAGNFIVVKDTREEAWETVREVEKTIKIITEPDGIISWQEIKRRAREKFNRSCFVCEECNGIECKGKFPGIGGIGNGNAFIRNYRDLSRILIKTKNIHNVTLTDCQSNFFGIKLDLPLIAAPITGCDINLGGMISELEYDIELVNGCKDAGIIGCVGDGAPQELYKIGLESIKNAGGFGGIIFKPRANQNDILKRIEAANKTGVKFLGIDIDAANFGTMDLFNQRVEPKTVDQLKELINASKVPFIIKGIMSTEDALNAVKAGADAIVVSNHGGRITDNHPSSISVLSDIVKAVKDKIKIIFDGGVRSGEDIYKVIAMGADYVMIGRPFCTAVMGGNRKGVNILVKKYKEQLKKIMLLTGCANLDSINKESLVCPDFNNINLDFNNNNKKYYGKSVFTLTF
jgi:isopentenyl diphosphate isomerase/L-lactate dehydrogenase-like FMN-dependent dehydrogenase/biotin carboxylase